MILRKLRTRYTLLGAVLTCVVGGTIGLVGYEEMIRAPWGQGRG